MQTVAEIAPMGRGPPLLAFICEECGQTESTLIYPSMVSLPGSIKGDNHEQDVASRSLGD